MAKRQFIFSDCTLKLSLSGRSNRAGFCLALTLLGKQGFDLNKSGSVDIIQLPVTLII